MKLLVKLWPSTVISCTWIAFKILFFQIIYTGIYSIAFLKSKWRAKSELRDLNKEGMSVTQAVKHFLQKQLQCMEQCRWWRKPPLPVRQQCQSLEHDPTPLPEVCPSTLRPCFPVRKSSLRSLGWFWSSLSKSWKKSLQRLPTAAWEWASSPPGLHHSGVAAVLVPGQTADPGLGLWTDFLTSCLKPY